MKLKSILKLVVVAGLRSVPAFSIVTDNYDGKSTGQRASHIVPQRPQNYTGVDYFILTMNSYNRDFAFDRLLDLLTPGYISRSFAVIDRLLASDGAFLAPDVQVGSASQPTDSTRDAFKGALVAKILSLDHTLAGFVPLTGTTIRDMANCQHSFVLAVQGAISAWVNTLLPGVDAPFTVSTAGGLNRDAFIDMLMPAFEY